MADVGAVADWFAGAGSRSSSQPANRSYLGLRGTAARLQATLGVGLVDRSDPPAATYHVPLGAPVVPAGCAGA